MKKGKGVAFFLAFLLLFSIMGASIGENMFFMAGEIITASAEEFRANAEELGEKVVTAFRILPQVLKDTFPPLFEEEPETETEEPAETEVTGEPLSPVYPVEKLVYIDANKKTQEMITDPFAPRNDYDKDAFSIVRGRMSYNGEGYDHRVGIDVSHHQGAIDWQRVAQSGIEFAIIRIGFRGYSSEGKLYEDRRWRKNLEGARAAGLDVGVYFFSQAVSSEEAAEEADFVLGLLDGTELDLPLIYDPESIKTAAARTDDVYGEQFTVNTRIFCDLVKAAGYEPMIYANMAWEDEKLEMAAIADIPVWFADYSSKPQSPYCFDFWQYTSHGSVPGIASRVDMNIQLIPVQADTEENGQEQ